MQWKNGRAMQNQSKKILCKAKRKEFSLHLFMELFQIIQVHSELKRLKIFSQATDPSQSKIHLTQSHNKISIL